jgi:hypothetical protein
MARWAPLLSVCCLGVAALWAGDGRADTLKTSARLVAAVGPGASFTLEPLRAPRWERGFSFNETRTLRLRSPSAPRAWSDALCPALRADSLVGWAPPGGTKPAANLDLASVEALYSTVSSRLSLRESVDVGATEPLPAAAASTDCSASDGESCGSAPRGTVGAERVGSDRPHTANVLTPFGIPPLLRYADEETIVSVSIAPGGPCTGACLKVAGSF